MFKTILSIICLYSISVASISYASLLQNSVEHLSATTLKGRRAGTIGNKLAGEFLEKKLKKWNLAPIGESYRQEFTIFTKMEKSGDNKAIQTSETLPSNFQPLTFSSSGSLSNLPLVFVGFGITLNELKYDDYKNVDVKDKVVIVLTGDPGIGNINSKFRNTNFINYRSINYKLNNAIQHGAKGILFIQDPLSLDIGESEPLPYFNETEGGGNRFAILAGTVSRNWAEEALEIDLKAIQEKISNSSKSISTMSKQKISIAVNLKRKTGRVANIVGVIKGQDERLSKKVIVIGAHFDHLGLGGHSSMEGARSEKVHHGADDNASGTSIVLKLAKKLSKLKLNHTYIIAFFNAEEMGLLGSQNFMNSWSRHEEEFGKIGAMINFDMVGRYTDKLTIMGLGSSNNWKNVSRLNNPKSKLNIIFENSTVGSSDHASFIDKEIPALFLTTGAHEDYHKSTDTSEKINFQALKRINKYAFRLIKELDKGYDLPFNSSALNISTAGRNRGYGSHLGCVPQFGGSSVTKGVLCTRASKGSPAMLAGIIANDIVTQIGDIEISNLYDLSFALKYYRAGDKIILSWLRDQVEMTKEIVLGKPKRH